MDNQDKKNNISPIVGIIDYLGPGGIVGGRNVYYDKDKYISKIKDSLNCGEPIKYYTKSNDPSFRKAVADIAYDEFGMDNPKDLKYFIDKYGGREDIINPYIGKTFADNEGNLMSIIGGGIEDNDLLVNFWYANMKEETNVSIDKTDVIAKQSEIYKTPIDLNISYDLLMSNVDKKIVDTINSDGNTLAVRNLIPDKDRVYSTYKVDEYSPENRFLKQKEIRAISLYHQFCKEEKKNIVEQSDTNKSETIEEKGSTISTISTANDIEKKFNSLVASTEKLNGMFLNIDRYNQKEKEFSFTIYKVDKNDNEHEYGSLDGKYNSKENKWDFTYKENNHIFKGLKNKVADEFVSDVKNWENMVPINAKDEKITKIGIFKLADGVNYGIRAIINNQQQPTRRLLAAEVHDFFNKKTTKEELAQKYFHHSKNEERTKGKIDGVDSKKFNVSVFKMRDGHSYAIRALIDGQQLPAAKMNKNDVADFFNKKTTKEELAQKYFHHSKNEEKQQPKLKM